MTKKNINNTTTLTLGHSKLTINRIGLGCMGMSEFYGPSNDTDSIKLLQDALEVGINFFDTADMYGCGHNEELIGKALKGRMNELTLATKFGIERGPNGERFGICGKPDYVKAACERSLKRLEIDQIDLYYMHRQDPDVPIEDTVGAMKELVEAGKVRYIGLSEVDSDSLRKAHQIHPISALQTEFSLWSQDPINDQFKTCEELGITFVSYSPLGRGFLTGAISRKTLDSGDFRLQNPRFQEQAILENQQFVDAIGDLAKAKDATKAQIAIAWILFKNPNLATIPGTRNLERLKQNFASQFVELSHSEVVELESKLPSTTAGERY